MRAAGVSSLKTRTILLAALLSTAGLAALAPVATSTAAADVKPFPMCQQLFVGPDIDQGVCIDPAADCIVLWYDTYGTGGGDRCYVSDPGVAVARIQRCERLFYGPDIDSGVCIDSAAKNGCYAWLYNAYGNDTCLVAGLVTTQASDERCLVQWTTHDWQRTSVCTSVKGDCKVYLRHEGVNNSRECLH